MARARLRPAPRLTRSKKWRCSRSGSSVEPDLLATMNRVRAGSIWASSARIWAGSVESSTSSSGSPGAPQGLAPALRGPGSTRPCPAARHGRMPGLHLGEGLRAPPGRPPRPGPPRASPAIGPSSRAGPQGRVPGPQTSDPALGAGPVQRPRRPRLQSGRQRDLRAVQPRRPAARTLLATAASSLSKASANLRTPSTTRRSVTPFRSRPWRSAAARTPALAQILGQAGPHHSVVAERVQRLDRHGVDGVGADQGLDVEDVAIGRVLGPGGGPQQPLRRAPRPRAPASAALEHLQIALIGDLGVGDGDLAAQGSSASASPSPAVSRASISLSIWVSMRLTKKLATPRTLANVAAAAFSASRPAMMARRPPPGRRPGRTAR